MLADHWQANSDGSTVVLGAHDVHVAGKAVNTQLSRATSVAEPAEANETKTEKKKGEKKGEERLG